MSVQLPAWCVVPCASLRFIQGHVEVFTDFFFFNFFFGGWGRKPLEPPSLSAGGLLCYFRLRPVQRGQSKQRARN